MWLSVRAQMRRADSCTTLSLIYIIWQIHQTRARWFICDFQSYDCFLRFHRGLRKCGACQHSKSIRWHLDGSVKNPLCDKRTLWYTPLSLFFIWCVYSLVNVFRTLRHRLIDATCQNSYFPGRTLEGARIGGASDVSFVPVLQFRSIQGDLLFPSFIRIISADGTQTYSNKSASN